MSLQLQDRDHQVLNHVKRYRITTNEVLLARFFSSPDALDGVRKRLLRNSYLQARPLGIGRRDYYQLTDKAARLLGEPPYAAKPLGLQSLARHYGVLQYCCILGPEKGFPREKLHRDELRETFPDLVDANLTNQSDFYTDTFADHHRLGRIVVDQGGQYTELIRKCRHIISRGSERAPGFVELVQADAFLIAIVTSEKTKRNAIIDALAKKPLGIRIRTEVVSELTTLLSPRPER